MLQIHRVVYKYLGFNLKIGEYKKINSGIEINMED